MKALLYKQLRLVCHPMTPVFCLFGIMVIIPNYPYTVIFFYVTLGLFFSFLNMREQKDLYYTALLPVPKRDAVKAGCLFTALVELASLVLLAPCCLLAAGFLLYALFNAVFLPSFYKSGYKVGVAFVKATIPMALLMLVMEALPHIPGLTWLDDMDAATQLRLLPVLIGSILIYTGCALLTFRAAARAYEKVDL